MRSRGACQRRNQNKNTRKFARKSVAVSISAEKVSKSLAALGKIFANSSECFNKAFSQCADRVQRENKHNLARMSLMHKCTERPKGSLYAR